MLENDYEWGGKGISLFLKECERITALVGTSGSVKSTLLPITAGLQPTSDGKELFEGNNMTTMSSEQVRASKFGFVVQFEHPSLKLFVSCKSFASANRNLQS